MFHGLLDVFIHKLFQPLGTLLITDELWVVSSIRSPNQVVSSDRDAILLSEVDNIVAPSEVKVGKTLGNGIHFTTIFSGNYGELLFDHIFVWLIVE